MYLIIQLSKSLNSALGKKKLAFPILLKMVKKPSIPHTLKDVTFETKCS